MEYSLQAQTLQFLRAGALGMALGLHYDLLRFSQEAKRPGGSLVLPDGVFESAGAGAIRRSGAAASVHACRRAPGRVRLVFRPGALRGPRHCFRSGSLGRISAAYGAKNQKNLQKGLFKRKKIG